MAEAVPSSASSSSSSSPTTSTSINQIFALFASHGASDYIGEAVTSLQHGLQAANCAALAGAEEEVIVAALLHDVGHMLGMVEPDRYERMGNCGVMCHEGVGGQWLQKLNLPSKTCHLVRRHVDAKRYLTWKTPEYYNTLSDASKTTLGYQGGPMSDEEGLEFEADPLKDTILSMRKWDESAKVPDMLVPDLESYRPMLERLISSTSSNN